MIKLEDVCFAYQNPMGAPIQILNNINAHIEDGEFVGLIGATGSGKSTLVSLLNGILKLDSGTITIGDKTLWQKGVSMRELRFEVGLCFQYPEYQLFEETVFLDIAFGPKNMKLSENEVKQRVEAAAEAVGLSEEILKKSPFELSGGQKRRAAIAGVLAMQPRVLILDEPAAGLDPAGRELILSRMCEYHKNSKSTIILVSHSMEDIARYADRVMVLKDGAIAYFDTIQKVFADAEQLCDMQLSVPEITKIFLELHRRGAAVPTDIYTVEYGAQQIVKYKK